MCFEYHSALSFSDNSITVYYSLRWNSNTVVDFILNQIHCIETDIFKNLSKIQAEQQTSHHKRKYPWTFEEA